MGVVAQRPYSPELAGRLRSTLAYGSLAALVAAGLAVALRASDPYSLTAAVHLPGRRIYALVVAMCVAYGGVLVLARHLRARWLIGVIALLHVAYLLAPTLLSTDVFNYVDYARLGVLHGIDPYAHGPVAARHDPAFTYTAWRHVGSAYGPLFTVATYPLAHLSVGAAVWALKGLAAASSLGCVALVWRIARQLGRAPAPAAAAFGLNPLVLVWTLGGAHNDLLMLVLMLAGVSLALAARESLGGAALVAAAAVKAVAGLALPFLLIASRRRGRVLIGVAAAGVVVAALSLVAFPGDPFGVVTVLARQHHFVDYNSVPTELSRLFGLHGVTADVRSVALAAFAAALVYIAVRVWRGADWIAATGWALVASVVTATWFLAWYAVWPLAFAAVGRDRRLLAATLGLQAFWLANHVPHVTL